MNTMIGGMNHGFGHLSVDLTKNMNGAVNATVQYQFSATGMEEDEYHYLFGTRPTSTAGIHYCDFGAEGELKRLSLFQDRWLGTYDRQIYGDLKDLDSSPSRISEMSFDLRAKGDSICVNSTPGKKLTATFKLQIDPIRSDLTSGDGSSNETEIVMLRLRSEHGMSGTIRREVKHHG